LAQAFEKLNEKQKGVNEGISLFDSPYLPPRRFAWIWVHGQLPALVLWQG
jgi:hypothetical protein